MLILKCEANRSDVFAVEKPLQETPEKVDPRTLDMTTTRKGLQAAMLRRPDCDAPEQQAPEAEACHLSRRRIKPKKSL